MSNEIKTRSLTPTEQKYTYAQSMQLEGQTGTIGHLRGDFATTGYGFYTTWFDTRPQWKSDEFKADLDTVINALREDKGLLHNRYDMSAFARHFPESAIKDNYCTEYGFRVDTEKHAFLLRCNPTKGDYNFYCYCYVKEWLDKHIEEANRDIRFIDSAYRTLFTIKDGESIVITRFDGEKMVLPCKYIDDCHVCVGNSAYHICEFAEMQERNGNTYVPSAPKISGEICTYEIYQIPATADVDYYFRSYEAAKGKLQSADYQRSYAGMYAKGNSLEDLWAKHNRDSRPFAHRMRSMSVSDIVVLTQGGRKTAYYADTIGFKKAPEFLAQQRAQKKHKERGEAR